MVVLLIPCVMILCNTDTLSAWLKYRLDYGFFCVLDDVQEIILFDRFKTVMVVMLSGICCFGVSDDLQSQYCRMILMRMDIRKYCLSKLLMNAAAVVSASVLGFLCYTLMMLPIMPVVNAEAGGYGYLDCFVDTPFPWLIIVCWAVLFAMFVVFLTSLSMWMSVYRPSRYVAVAVPFGVFYVLYALTTVPRILPVNLWYISSGVRVLGEETGFLMGFGYAVLVFGSLTAVCGYGFYRAMERRVKNGEL